MTALPSPVLKVVLAICTLIIIVNGNIINNEKDKTPYDYVNTLGGSDSKHDMSHGSTLPMVTRPFGFNAWVPQTNLKDNMWWFHPRDNMFFGMRCTHQPSPWINDYGQFLIQATLPGTSSSAGTLSTFASGYNTKKSYFKRPDTFPPPK